jgi:hypothetical protein
MLLNLKMTNNLKGCAKAIILFVAIFIGLKIFLSITNVLEMILSNPFINYGIPILILIIIAYRSKKSSKKTEDD